MYTVAIPAIVGLLRYRALIQQQRAILLLVWLSAFTEGVARWLAYQSWNQTPVYLSFTIMEFLLLTFAFSQGLQPMVSKRTLGGIVLGFLLFLGVDMIWLSGMTNFNSYSTAVEGLILISFCLLFFYKTLTELKIEHLEREPLFWISAGVMLYFASNLFIFLFTNYVKASRMTLFVMWGIHGIFGILLNLFYSIALWVKPKP